MQQEPIYQSPLLADMDPEEYVVSPASKTMLVPVFREPDESAQLLKRLPADTIVTAIARLDSWLFVRIAPGEHGYIRASDARSLNAPETVADAESSPVEGPSPIALLPYIVDPSAAPQSVSVFCEPSLNVPVIGSLDAGARIEVISQDASWLYIQFSPEQRGYIEVANARPAEANELLPNPIIISTPSHYVVKPASGRRAAVFREASQSSELFAFLEPGTTVEVEWESEFWLRIQHSPGKYGYIRQIDAKPLGTSSRASASTNGTGSNVVRWTSKAPYPLISPRRYIIKSVVGLRTAVFREADQSSEILGDLESDTIVEVVWISERWLGIQRSPGEYAYIRRINARPARTGELGRGESSNGSAPTVKPPHPLMSQPLRYVISPTLSMRIPVFQEASRDSKILEYLEPETIVEVVWKSEIWLCINRSSGEYGYIKAMYASPFSRRWEAGKSTYASGLSVNARYNATSYNDGRAKARPWFRATRRLFGTSMFLLIGGTILASIQEQTCAFIFCQTTYPFAGVAVVCYVIGFILLVICVITLITALVIRASS